MGNHDLQNDKTVFFYVYNGEIIFNDQKFGRDTMVVLGEASNSDCQESQSCESDTITIKNNSDHNSKVFMCHSNPINENIFWHGPFVVNTKEEMDETFRMFQSGKA